MSLKKIVLHGPTLDAANRFCDAGTELTVAARPKEGEVSAEVARDLVNSGRAVSATAEAAQEAAN